MIALETDAAARGRWRMVAAVPLLVAAAPGAPGPPGDPPAPPVAHWPLDAEAGTTAADAVDRRHDGTLGGGARRIAGAVGNAVDFDGDGGHVRLPASALFDNWSRVTVAAWVRPRAGGTGRWPTIIEKAAGGESKHPHVLWIGAHRRSRNWALQLASDRGHNRFLSFRVPMTLDVWSHVAFVIDVAGGRARLYVDGELRGDRALELRGAALWSHRAGPSAIGMIAAGNNNFWTGGLDDVRIYRDLLGLEAIRALARRRSGPPPTPRNTE